MNKKGFSLLELAIVISIIGILLGGIIGGQSLIKASKLNSITTDVEKYKNAISIFKDRYNGLPGDITNATALWGAAAVPASCATTQGTGTQTCDGNGDGVIGTSFSNEMFRAWQQLANAGLIDGVFTGVGGAGGATEALPGQNVPSSKVDQAGFTVANLGLNPNAGVYFAGDYSHTFIFGAKKPPM